MNSESYIKQSPPNDDAPIYTSQELQNIDKNKKMSARLDLRIMRGVRLYRGYMLQFDRRTFESWGYNGLYVC